MRTKAALALALLLGACVGPARTSDAYAGKASTSLQDSRSAVETARLAVDAAEGDRATGPYLSVLLADAEEQAASVQTTFASIQPPNEESDRLREEVDALLGEATSLLADLRIAARRGDTAGLVEKRAELENLSRRIEEVADRLG